ncbi:hypothetical protein Plhal703r1_c09g0047191 [Plasmopara halstedii]
MCSVCSCDHEGSQTFDIIPLKCDEDSRGHDQEGYAAYIEQDDVDGMKQVIHSGDDIATEQEHMQIAMASLRSEVHTLRNYKTNYELLCGQVSELNAQIGLHLQRHESDVTAFQTLIADLQTEKMALEAQVVEVQERLNKEYDKAEQDREYSEQIHQQLGTVAELLKATEKRLEQQESHYMVEIKTLRAQLASKDDNYEEIQIQVQKLEQEIKFYQAQEIAAKEQDVARKERAKSKHKQEIKARALKLQELNEEIKTQRSTVRATKKQLAKMQAKNNALCKQLANVKRDGAHLSSIINSQRVQYESQVSNFLNDKKQKKQFAKRVTALSQEVEQLQRDLADAKDKIVSKNDKLGEYRNELECLHHKQRQTFQKLEETQRINDNLMKQIRKLQNASSERHAHIKMEKQIQRESRDMKELISLRELLADNQQHATVSSQGVQKLRRELVTVQNLLQCCAQEQQNRSDLDEESSEEMCENFLPDDSIENSAQL